MGIESSEMNSTSTKPMAYYALKIRFTRFATVDDTISRDAGGGGGARGGGGAGIDKWLKSKMDFVSRQRD